MKSLTEKARKKLRKEVVQKLDEHNNLVKETASFQKVKKDLEKEVKSLRERYTELKVLTDKEREKKNKGRVYTASLITRADVHVICQPLIPLL